MVIAILATLQMPWTAALPPHGASIDILRPKFDGGGSVGERTVTQAGASPGMASGKARPSVHVIVPLNQGFVSGTQIVLGLGVAVAANL